MGCDQKQLPILRTTTIKSWLDWFPEAVFGPINYGSPITHHLRYKLPDNTQVDAEVMFMSLDMEGDLKKLLSLEITGAWLNEAKEIRRDAFDLVQTRTGRYPAKRDASPTWSGLILDSNPPPTDHWLHRVFVEELPREWSFYKQPPGNGPDGENIQNLPNGYYKRIAVGKDEDWQRVYIEGEFGYSSAGKAIHPAFRYTQHVNPKLERLDYNRIVIGLDFGLTPAATFMQNRGQTTIIYRDYLAMLPRKNRGLSPIVCS